MDVTILLRFGGLVNVMAFSMWNVDDTGAVLCYQLSCFIIAAL